ncbi:MAG: type II secretion system F family protein [Steroidobacteraceae bacterium]|jgi:tight adherence protein B|nr:secretion system protein [Gammaproteobacteria bacterium]
MINSLPAWIALAAAIAAMTSAIAITMSLRWGSRRHRQRLAHLSEVGFAGIFLFLDRQTFWRLNALAALVVPLLVWGLLGWGAALATFALVLVAPSFGYRVLSGRRRTTLQRQLPDAASALATALRGGLSLSQSLEQVVRYQPQPISQEFSLMMREHRLGVPLDRALAAMADRIRLRDFDLLVSTLAIARDLGSGLAEALERYAQSVRRRLTLEDRIRALTAQGRLQGIVMGLLPVILAVALMMVDPLWMQPLFTTLSGWLTLAAVAVLELLGFLLIRKIIDIRI